MVGPASRRSVLALAVLAFTVVALAAVAAPATVHPTAAAPSVADPGGVSPVTAPSPAVHGVERPPATADAVAAGRLPPPRVRIATLYPNPAADEDRGEFVVLAVSRRTNLSGYRLDDGEGTVALSGQVRGRVAVTEHPERVRNLTRDGPVAVERVVAVESLPTLANGGERVTLRRNNRTVDAVEYEEAPERSVFDGGGWRHLDATNRSVGRYGAREVRAFALPDAPDAAVELLASADRRVLLAGYTLESERVTRALRAAVARGVTVRVLVDAGPVGGVSRRQVRLLDRLSESGVDVRVYGTDGAPYAYHHAKYAVVDDRVLVATENWEPGGLGGAGHRGWGAVVTGDDLAADLATVFRADASRPAALPWSEYRDSADPVFDTTEDAAYPSRFGPARVRAESVRLLLAPDNAESTVVTLLADADRSVRIQQVSMEEGPLLAAAVDAARRGVEVRILLSSASYVRAENRRLATALNDRADREGWPLTVRLADARGRYDTVHTKGAIVDDSVVLGSLNWNDHSGDRNREVVLVLEGGSVRDYYGAVFAADWGDGGAVPTWLVLVAVAAVVLAAVVGYRLVRFGGRRGR